MKKAKARVEKNYIHFPNKTIYAICYFSYKKVYYNLDFDGKVKLYMCVSGNENDESNKIKTYLRKENKNEKIQQGTKSIHRSKEGV